MREYGAQPDVWVRRRYQEERRWRSRNDTQTPARPSLYDRLGGVYNIAPVVDDLIDRVMKDQRLNANPRVDEAHHRVSAAGFKYFVTEMLCEAAGGPQRYSGRPMGDVPQPAQEEIKAIVESTHAPLWLQRGPPAGG